MKKKILLISLFIIVFMLCIPNIVFADFADDAEDYLSDKEAWIKWLDDDSEETTLKEKKNLKTGEKAEDNKLVVKTVEKFKITKNKTLRFRIYFEAEGMDIKKAKKWTTLNYVEKKDENGEFKKDEAKNKYNYQSFGGEDDGGWFFNNEGIEHNYTLTFFEAGTYKCHMHIGDGEVGERIYYIIEVTVDKSEEEIYAEEIETAYQGDVPSTSDGAEEIIKFVFSDAEYNTGTKKIDNIELDKLKAWKIIVEEFDEESSPAWGYREPVLQYLNAEIAEREGIISAEEADKLKKDALENAKKYLLAVTSSVDPGQDRTPNTFYDVLENVEDYIPGVDLSNDDEAEEMLSVVLTIITNIGVVLSVLIPAILGVKYMLGSTEEKAQYKESLLPYFIGSGILFGICTVVKVLEEIGVFINS